MISRVLINGVPTEGMVPVTDSSVLRGDGCFEVIKVYSGRPFAVDAHLDRLERSAKALEIELPSRDLISEWVEDVAATHPDGLVRVVVTRGTAIPGAAPEPLTVVFAHDWEKSEGPARLLPLKAPWHAAGEDWELAGAKVLSYAPNLSASRRALAEGYDDAARPEVAAPPQQQAEAPTAHALARHCQGHQALCAEARDHEYSAGLIDRAAYCSSLDQLCTTNDPEGCAKLATAVSNST